MKIRSTSLFVALLLLLPATLPAQVSLTTAFPGISFSSSVDIQAPPDGSDRLFIVERGGTIRIVDDIFGSPVKLATAFFDVPDGTFVSGGERGLLGMAFHPDYASNGYFYVFYTVNPPGAVATRTVVSRFTVSAGDPNLADTSTELDIIGVDHPFSNHNAGQIQFGPDSYLYVGMGDGGAGGDPQNNGQNKQSLLATILRIDVDGGGLAPDSCGDITANYTVPADNPFVDGSGGDCDEIFAYGIRNPWRFSFGPDGKLWVADVGQNAFEEISWVGNGDNMGWNVKEGYVCYPSGSPTCNDPQYTDPIYVHAHGNFGASISGGYVYTGESCGALNGQYVFADYALDFVRSLSYDDNGVTAQNSLDTRPGVTSFGIDRKNNLYAVTIFGALLTIDCDNVSGLSLKAILAGPYDDATNLMTTDLNTAGLIPSVQPYNDAIYDGQKAEHDGNEMLSSDFFSSQSNLVDWVIVELRQTPTAAPLVKRAALIRNDGIITDFDGGPVRFFGLTGSYHAVVHHRNHLSIMSAGTVTLSTSPSTYDFTSAQAQAYGLNPMIEVEPGVFALYGGDGDLNSQITAFDFLNVFLPQNGTVGYLGGDFNLSDDVTAFDFLQVWLPANGKSSQVP